MPRCHVQTHMKLGGIMSNDRTPVQALPPSDAAITAQAGSGPKPALPERIGKYRVLERIGVGGVGVVYKCLQADLNRTVAVKVLNVSQHAVGEQRLRFEREAHAAAKLVHPHVVQIHDVGVDGDRDYLVMEFVDGVPLDRLIGTPQLTVDRTLRIIYHVARAVQAAHEQGIIHRDIKPSNILIDRAGQPKLADFGLAKWLAAGPSLSATGDLIGTPRYMAPEQVVATSEEGDERSDVYALGVVMYEMLTGEPPVSGSNVLNVLLQVTEREPVPVRTRNPAAPEEVAAICRRAMAKAKDERFQSAEQFAKAIQALLMEKFIAKAERGGGAREQSEEDATLPAIAAAEAQTTGVRNRLPVAGGKLSEFPGKRLAVVGLTATVIILVALGWIALSGHAGSRAAS